MVSLGDLLREAAGVDDREGHSTIPPEAAVERLQEASQRLRKALVYGPQFKVGDIVTPHPDSTVRGKGEPHLVVEVLHDAPPIWEGSKGGENTHGARFDMRVLSFGARDRIFANWVESWNMTEWKPGQKDSE